MLATPLKTSIEQLQNFPDAMIINSEADVLRDESIAYGNKLREAGNNVTAIQLQGILHKLVMLNSLDKTNACRAPMDVSVS